MAQERGPAWRRRENQQWDQQWGTRQGKTHLPTAHMHLPTAQTQLPNALSSKRSADLFVVGNHEILCFARRHDQAHGERARE